MHLEHFHHRARLAASETCKEGMEILSPHSLSPRAEKAEWRNLIPSVDATADLHTISANHCPSGMSGPAETGMGGEGAHC